MVGETLKKSSTQGAEGTLRQHTGLGTGVIEGLPPQASTHFRTDGCGSGLSHVEPKPLPQLNMACSHVPGITLSVLKKIILAEFSQQPMG